MNLSTPTQSPAVRVQAVSKRYGSGSGSVTALEGIDLQLRRGEFTAIMGPSGSGKSTLMHLMAGLDTPTEGKIWLGDTEITSLEDRPLTELRRSRIGFVFQSFNLVPTLNALDNILLPFELGGTRVSAQQREFIDGLCRTLGLGDRLDHRPSQLSGGQQQRVAIVRALATQPDMIFADEPTGALDSRNGREVLSLLAEASRRYGQSIAMVTHDAVAASYADRILVMQDGRVRHDVAGQSAEQVSALMLELEPAA